MTCHEEVTELLAEVRAGTSAAIDRVYSLVYQELHRLAQLQLRHERSEHTLQPTALVNEAYLRLVNHVQHNEWQDRGHFFAVASRAMRQILVDHARSRSRKKRGGDVAKTTRMDLENVPAAARSPDLLDLDDALRRLSQADEMKGRIVELRYFGGLTNREVSEVLGVSVRSVERHWNYARAWLFRALQEREPEVAHERT